MYKAARPVDVTADACVAVAAALVLKAATITADGPFAANPAAARPGAIVSQVHACMGQHLALALRLHP